MYPRSRALRALHAGAARHVDGLITRRPPLNPRCLQCLAPTASFHTSSRLSEAGLAANASIIPTPHLPNLPKLNKRRKGAPGHSTNKAPQVVCTISSADASLLTIESSNTSPTQVPAGWLRDRCPQSTSPSSGNKNFATGEIPVDIAFESARLDEDGNWEITWRNNIPRFAAAGLNTSVFTPEQLLTALKPGFKTAHLAVLQNHTSWNPKVWSRSTLYPREISWENWMAGKASFAAAVAELAESGLVFITGVPKKHDSVKRVALQFGGLKETFYGNTWDVVSKPQAENVAYTSEYLGLHSDMLYLNSPPKLQFLHCLENDAVGGESLFSDAMRTAAEMISQKPEMAEVLGEVNMGWHYDNNGFFYQQSRPVFQGMGKVSPDTTNPQEGSEQLSSNRRQASRNTRRTLPTDVWWSPPFQTPLRAPTTPEARKRYGEWLAAASTFQNMLEDEANMIRRRLRAGDCVVFDNRRVLHGRTAFDASSGGRHLRGAYVDIDEWRSTLKRVEREYELPAFLKARGEALQAWTKAEHAQPATQEVDESGAEVRASVSA